MKFDTPLHYLVTPSGSRLIGHCLEYDLVVSADSYHETLRRLTFIVGAHVRTAERQGAGLALKHKAPEMYWKKFEHFRMADGIHENINGVLCEVAQSTTSTNALQ
jgi:hypothetical protein